MAQPDLHGTSPTGGDERTDIARQEGAEVADDAKQQAQATAGTAKEEAGRVASEAQRHARDLAYDARDQLQHQARNQTENVGGALEQFGHRLHALAEGRTEDAGQVGSYANRMADQVDDLARRVQERGFDGIVEDVQDFARRRPGAFLAGALAAGFIVSRLARGVRDASDSSTDMESQQRRPMRTEQVYGTEGTYAGTGAGTQSTGLGTGTGTGAPTESPPLPPPTPAPPAGAMGDVPDRPDPLSAGRTNPGQPNPGRTNP